MPTYNLDRQLYYLHFPKTAGTAFAQHLVPVLGNRLSLADWKTLEGEDVSQYSWIHGHMYYEQIERVVKNPILMTMLRHPIERIYSLYRFHGRRPNDTMYDLANSISFHEFVEKRIGSQVYVSMLSDQIENDGSNFKVITGYKGRERLDIALERLERFDVIGITEYFDYSLLMLAAELNIEPFWQTSRANSAPTPTLREDIPDETIKLIRQVAAADIEIYDRAVELFKSRIKEKLKISTGI